MHQLDASHPIFDGHFPGNPLVPGAYLLAIVLEEARTRLREMGSDRAPVGVRTVKFLAPVRPAQPFHCQFDPIDEHAWRFKIEGGTGRIAVGTLLVAAREPGGRPVLHRASNG